MLYILCGYAATGKDKYLNLIIERHPKLDRLLTMTTRPARENERNYEDYIFIDKREFMLREKNGDLLAIRIYNTEDGKEYGYGLSSSLLDIDKNSIIILDFKGAAEMKQKYGDKVRIIYLYSEDYLITRRALKRGDDPLELQERIKKDKKDLKYIVKDIDIKINTNTEGMHENNLKIIDAFLEENIWI